MSSRFLRVSPALAAMLVAALVAACVGPAPDPVQPPPESLLLITLDTTRPDHLTPYGAPAGRTPAMQRLADQGVVMDSAFAVAPLTLPSHASLFTGLNPLQHGVRNNGTYRLDDRFQTLAETLQQSGFRTAAFVAATVVDGRYGVAQGFETFDDSTSGRPDWQDGIERRAEPTVTAAIEWLNQRVAGERYLAWVHLFDPHSPFDPPAPFDDRYPLDPYSGEIAYLDQALEPLLDHPAVHDQLVVVIADHGESLLEHGEANHGMLLYDSSLRIPWILHHPALPAGIRVAEPVSQIDLLPTVLDLLGVPHAAPVDGISLLPLLQGGPLPDSGKRPLYAETWLPYLSYRWSQLHAVRVGRWKYIEGPDPELFDLDLDPQEERNLIDREPAIARRLASILAESLRAEEASDSRVNPTETDLARLRTLGYVGEPGAELEGPLPDPKVMIDLHRRIGEAQQAIERGELAAADQKLAKVLVDDPTNVTALSERARIAGLRSLPEQTLRYLKAALDLAPDNGNLSLQLGSLLLTSGQPSGAIAHLTRAIELLDPVPATAHVYLAQALGESGQWDRAEEQARRALAVNGHSPAAANLLAAALEERGRVDEAMAVYQQLLTGQPEFVGGHFNLGLLLKKLGRYTEASESFRAVLEIEPQHAKAHFELAFLYAGLLNKPDRALDHYRQCAAVDPDHPRVAFLRRALGLD